MEKYDCQTICELGVRDGENFELLIEHKPQEAFAVDVWKNDGTYSHNDLGFSQTELDSQYQNFAQNMTDHNFVKIYREYTSDAVRHFPDEYFDFIYIDADHSYEGCLRDLMDWYPKLKKGKFLAGHDFIAGVIKVSGVRFGVIEALNHFAKDNNLTVYKMRLTNWVIVKP